MGARLPVTAIWIAIELKLAKPHSANVTTATVCGARSLIWPSSMNATN